MEFSWENLDPNSMNGDDILKRIPAGIGKEIGLLPSIPAVRVWGCINFERAFSGNEKMDINETVTDIEPFLYKDGNEYKLDARARIRATKFNYVRENFFRESLRRIMKPFLDALAENPEGEGAKKYLSIIDQVIKEMNLDGTSAKELRDVVVKMATCTPLDPCGVCPACIAEGAAASTSTEGALPVNWEKKFKETDFKTFFTVASAVNDLSIPAGSQILEPSLLEKIIRNRVPRAGTTEEGGRSEEMMFFVEYMFKGPGYFKTTLFNPTKLELAMLSYEHLVKEVRRGAKTSSGAGIWDYCYDEDKTPMIVVDEILSIKGYLANPPPPSLPLNVRNPETGYSRTFYDVIRDCSGICQAKVGDKAVLIRYVGEYAVKRLEKYLEGISLLDSENAFKLLVEYAASVIKYLREPKEARTKYGNFLKNLEKQEQKQKQKRKRSDREEKIS